MITNLHYRPLELPGTHRLLIILAMVLVFVAVLLWPRPSPQPGTNTSPEGIPTPITEGPAG